MSIAYKLGDISDLAALIKAGDELFDYPVKEHRAKEFLNDSRHHLFLAYDGQAVVGMASGLHYVHPDKDPSLFIDEVGVVDAYQSCGIGRELVKKLVAYARKELDCKEAWVLTDESNLAAQKAYFAAGGKREDEKFVLIEF
ncbi:MAG: GNAT family N-acetyltransferase [Ekhidna sp.]